MMNSVAPVWDGNETWLVLGGGGLFAVFPLAYAVIMPALYAPIIAMLLGLVLARRRVRVPLEDAARQVPLGLGVRRRLDDGRVRAGHCARRAGAGHPGRRPRLCRRLVGLADAFQPAHRRRARRRLRAARRRPGSSTRPRAQVREQAYRVRPRHGGRDARPHLRRQSLDAVPERRCSCSAGSRGRRSCSSRRCRCWSRSRDSSCSRACAERNEAEAVPRLARVVRAVLRRPADQLLPVPGADLGDDLGGRRAGRQPRVPAGRAPPC